MSMMSIEKKLAKITRAELGIGGYQDCQLGLFLTFEGKGWGIGTNEAYWDCNLIKVTDRTEWTEAARSQKYDSIMRKVSDILKAAKVDSVSKLAGIPVEITLDGNVLKDWRVLEEVL